jgi:hypothetical protein
MTKLHRFDRYAAVRTAVRLAVSEKLTFNAPTLAIMLGVKDNRHLRAVLKDLVSDGVLVSVVWLCEDGHYRKFWYAPGTKPMRELLSAKERGAA